MSSRATSAVQTASLVVACAAGLAIAKPLPYAGVPIAASAVALLVSRGRSTAAVAGALFGVLAAMTLFVSDVLYASLLAAALVVGARALSNGASGQVVGAGIAALAGAGAVLSDAVAARMRGMTLPESIASTVDDTVALLGGAFSAEQSAAARDLMLTVWPSVYSMTAILSGAIAVGALAWGARRAGSEYQAVPRIQDFDVTPHVLWGIIAGFSMLAASSFIDGDAAALSAIGLNVLMATRMVLFVQGIAALSGVFKAYRNGPLARWTLYALLFVVDSTLFIVSLAGLLDLWADLRKMRKHERPNGLNEPVSKI